MEWRKDDYLITDDKSKVQLGTVQRLLAATYWGGRRPVEIVERMVAGSICFSLTMEPRKLVLGVQIDSTIMAVGAMVKDHESSPS